MEIHKVLKNGPKIKIYTIIWKKRSYKIQICHQKDFHISKIPKKGTKPKFVPKMTLNELYKTFEVNIVPWELRECQILTFDYDKGPPQLQNWHR